MPGVTISVPAPTARGRGRPRAPMRRCRRSQRPARAGRGAPPAPRARRRRPAREGRWHRDGSSTVTVRDNLEARAGLAGDRLRVSVLVSCPCTVRKVTPVAAAARVASLSPCCRCRAVSCRGTPACRRVPAGRGEPPGHRSSPARGRSCRSLTASPSRAMRFARLLDPRHIEGHHQPITGS